MNALAIIATICRKRCARSRIFPNYTPHGWWECDAYEISPAGYATEYEVKLTRQDFKADAEKLKAVRSQAGRKEAAMESKHALLAGGDQRGPARFFYVVPEGMLSPEIVPAWAGLIIMRQGHHGRWHEQVAKKAPRLHGSIVPCDVAAHAEKICYWRMHRLMERLARKCN